MDPESSNDGTFQPNKSIGIAGHCEDCPLHDFLLRFRTHGITG